MSGHVGTKRLVVMNLHDFDDGRFTPVPNVLPYCFSPPEIQPYCY